MYPHIDSRHLSGSLPRAFLDGLCHRRVCKNQFRTFLFPCPFPRIVHVSWPAVGQTQFKKWTVAVGLVAVVVSRNSPAHRGKGTVSLAELVVDIHSSLQRIEAFGFVVAVLLEGLHVVVTQVAA